jgi:hypothetical protein
MPVCADALAVAGQCLLGDAVVDFSALRVERDGQSQRLSPKAMAVLLVLA